MAETYKKVGTNLEVTKVGSTVIETRSLDELNGTKREIQSKIDHLIIDRTNVDAELVEIQTKIDLIK